MRLLIQGIVVGLLLSACTPLEQPATVPADASPSPCELSQILPQVDKLLAGSEYEADYLTINHQLALSIWLVDPSINPTASDREVAPNRQAALLTGVRLAYRMVTEIPCTRTLFAVVNPMIVDRDYNGWYIDIIPMSAIPMETDPTDETLLTSLEQSGMEIAYLRKTPPQPPAVIETVQTCTWAEAHRQIEDIFGQTRRNVSAYLITGYQAIPASSSTEPVYAQVQWDVSSQSEASQEAVLAVLERLTKSLACLTPAVDRLETYVVDAQGKVLVYALIPDTVIQADQASLDPAQFTLIFFSR